jgi:hypothetical protein
MLPANNPIQYQSTPTNTQPTLTVSSKGRAYLSKLLRRQLDLRADQAIDLLPPTDGSPLWRLDLNLTASRRLYWYADTRPRIEALQVPAGLLEPGQKLLLRLLPGGPAFPNIYLLLPDALFTQASPPPVAAAPRQA